MSHIFGRICPSLFKLPYFVNGVRHSDDWRLPSSFPQEALLPSPFVQSSRWVESEGGSANLTNLHQCVEDIRQEQEETFLKRSVEQEIFNQRQKKKVECC